MSMVEQFFNASQFRPGLNNFVLFRVWRALSAGQDFVRPFFAQYCSATVDHIPSVYCNGTSRITNDTSEGVTKPKVSNASNFEDEKNRFVFLCAVNVVTHMAWLLLPLSSRISDLF